MRKVKVKYPVSNAVYKEIKTIAQGMPKIARTNGKGKVLERKLSKSILFKDMDEKQQEKARNMAGSNAKILPTDRYVLHYTEPVFVNHEVELVTAYEGNGRKGLEAYCAHVKSLVDIAESEKRAEEEEKALKEEKKKSQLEDKKDLLEEKVDLSEKKVDLSDGEKQPIHES